MKAAGQFPQAAYFYIGHVNIHQAIHKGQRLGSIIATSIVDNRQAQIRPGPLRGGAGTIWGTTWVGETRLMLWQPVDCSSSMMLANSWAVTGDTGDTLADVVVLAIDAVEVAAGEEDWCRSHASPGARPPHPYAGRSWQT